MTRAAVTLLFMLVAGAACPAGTRAPERLRRAEDVLASDAPGLLAASLADARRLRPGLEPLSDAAPGTSATTWIDPASPDTLEIDVVDGVVVAVRLAFHAARADEAEHRLRLGLGPGVECSPLPDDVQGFRVTLWALEDGSGVSLQRMLKHLRVGVSRPADSTFRQAKLRCRGAL
jgi:hypothetical protein